MKKYLSVCSPWIHTLSITSMKSSLDIELITSYLPLLTELTLSYGLKNVGMNYTI